MFDTSIFGATSPVQGQRYRFEASPTFGRSISPACSPTTAAISCRRTFYTLASRVMHYGRYGGGGEDTRLFPLFIGYP